MMRYASVCLLLLTAIGMFVGACKNAPQNPTKAQQTYGTSVDALDAVPAPAVAAEPSRYVGHRVTVDGRIIEVRDDGCTLPLDTEDGPPFRVEAPRTNDGSCEWQVSVDTDGFAVAAGTLRVVGDSLRLTANGVQVTPVQIKESDS